MKEQPSKEERKRLLIEMMKEDEKNGMYEKSDNELIAEFMKNDAINSPHLRNAKELEWTYEHSWDWLMPVCHKWDNLYKTDPLLSDRSTERYEEYLDLCYKLDDVVSVYEIVPTYKQIVNNIKWYNSQQHERK